MLHQIFNKQQELINDYIKIEKKLKGDNIVVLNPTDLDSPEYQDKLRRIAWYVFEESQEAMTALAENQGNERYLEEMVDCLHFMTELCIFSGVSADNVLKGNSPEEYESYCKQIIILSYLQGFKPNKITAMNNVLLGLGQAINMLKNKPWKQTLKPTDPEDYKHALKSTYQCLILCFFISGIDTLKGICNEYMKKHQINKERQANGY